MTCVRAIVFSVTLAGLSACAAFLHAAQINIPNGSFESPATVFVSVNIDSWQKTDKPAWYDESGGFLWSQLTGIFKNTPAGNTDSLDNCDGAQAMWMFALPEVGIFQDYNSTDWSNSVPTHAFNATFDPGKSYVLTAGINGGGGGMSNGATIMLKLYYRDAASNQLTVAATTITNTPEKFPNHTHLFDFQALLPTVSANDPWAGQKIGIELLSTVTTNLQGGYWDIDHIRLSSYQQPKLATGAFSNQQFQCVLQSEPGTTLEIFATANPALPFSSWTSLGLVTNSNGTASFTDSAPAAAHRFYRARQVQ
ncbi:MAG TPA: hypothetical protein VGE41_12850 [Verrucomicrobiae bacterium]|jgi:hypothetical protein